jgi:hypothetical protein
MISFPFGHAGGLARAVSSLHHNRDTRACGERRFGSADFWLHVITAGGAAAGAS